MPSFDNTIEFTEIILRSPLPLYQCLADDSRLSLRLIVNGIPCSETPVVDGDRETGKWVINSRIHVPQESRVFKLAAIANMGELKVQFSSITHSVAEVVARLKERPDGYRKIYICEPESPIQLSMMCKVKLSSSPASLSFRAIGNARHTADTPSKCKSGTGSQLEDENPTLLSREGLESCYLKVASLRNLNSKASALSLLGYTYYALYRKMNQKADLEKAISMHEEAIQFTSAFHPELAKHLGHAGDALKTLFEQSGEPAVIEKAISHYEKAVDTTDDSDPTRASHLHGLGNGLFLRFKRLGSLADIDRTIIVQQEVVEITPDGHPDKPGRLKDLGTSLFRRFKCLGSLTDIDRAITVQQKAVEITPDGHPDKPGLFAILGISLAGRFEHLGSLTDIDSAITVKQKAVEITPDGHPDKPALLTNLGNSLTRRFERLGSLSDIDSAITVKQKTVEITPDGHPDKPALLANLGSSLTRRFERIGSLADIDSAITLLQNAIEITPDGHPDKADLLANLGGSLTRRFERLGSLADIDSAIKVEQKAVETTSDGHGDTPAPLVNFGGSLTGDFERLGSLADIDRAITALQKAVEITPDGRPNKPALLGNLGASLLCRFERLGSLADIDSAITILQNAVEITPDGRPNKPALLSNLGTSLLCRFERLGSIADIDSAIKVLQKAIEITPDSHPNKPTLFTNLGGSLTGRFERLGSLADIDSAITILQNAVEITPDGHPNKPGLFANLGNSLTGRFERLGSLADIDRAIKVLQNAVEITPDGHADKPGLLTNLGGSLTGRFERLGSLADIDSAIAVHQKAVEITPDDHPDKPDRLNNLGNSLTRRFDRLGNCDDLENALQSYSRATYSPIGRAMTRFTAARAWATVAKKNSRSPLPAFRCAIDLLPRIAWLGLIPTDQHALLADVGDVVRDAIAAAVEFEEYESAVEWAEQGRSVVWQNLLGLRSSTDDLCKVNPGLANRLKSIAQRLESPVSQGVLSDTMPAKPIEDVARRYSELGTEWDNTVEEIRRIPNFEEFLKAKSFAKLAPAASEGPVVILNVHQSRSDALVLIPDESSELHSSVISIPLEPSTYVMSKMLFTSMTHLLSSAGVRSRSIPKHESIQPSIPENPSSYEACKALFEDLIGRLSPPEVRVPSRQHKWVERSTHEHLGFDTILGLLWLGVAKPVLDGLGFSAESGHPPRIWWCATGPLAFLPIHAAGIYGTGSRGHITSDYVISSYTPTLTAILDQSQPVIQADFQMLTVAVAQPSTLEAMPIPGTESEVTLVQNLAKANGVHCENLTKESATVQRVLKGMMESNWIHLACHGQQSIKNAMQSGFLLHDRVLDLSEIVNLSLPKADFAFLSACQTATGDEKVAEESVHLAAGMLLSGCRGVIATMWSIRDSEAPKVAEDIYSRILKDGRPHRKEAAYALHEAVKRLRESGADFLSWVPFIHIGR